MNPDPLTYAQTVVVNITAELNGLKAGNARLIVERDKALEACATEKQRADQEEIAAARYAKTIFDLRAQLTEAQEQMKTLLEAINDYLAEPSIDGRAIRQQMRQRLTILAASPSTFNVTR